MAHDVAKGFGPLPGSGKRADPSRADAADRATRGVIGHGDRKAWKQLIEQELHIGVAECVVLDVAVRVATPDREAGTAVARLDERTDADRHLASMDEVVEHH